LERGRELEVPLPPCPVCAGPTGRWSGYERHLRGERDRLIWIPRVRHGSCEVDADASFQGDQYQVDAAMVGRQVELHGAWWAVRASNPRPPR
jgi:hypothetical protein